MKKLRSVAMFAAISFGVHGVVGAAPAGAALVRPAVASAHASQAVLMGAAQAGGRLVAVGERGIVVWSDDSGRQWHQAKVPVSVTLTAVQFVDAQHGWAVGHGGVVLASHDGGLSWHRQLDGIEAARILHDEAKAARDPAAIKQADRMVAEGADKPLLALHFFDQTHGIVVGAFNMVLATADGGKSWQSWSKRIDNPQAFHLYTIQAKGSTVLIAGEQGSLYKSDDAGQHFMRMASPYKGSFFTAEVLNDHDILVAGLRGNAWHSTDDGMHWSMLTGAPPVTFTTSTTRATGEVLLANGAGQLFSLKQGTLQPIPAPALPPPAGLLPLANGSLLALTARGAIVVPATAGVRR